MPNCSDSPLLPSPKEVAGWESAQQRCEQIQEGLGTSPEKIFAVAGAISGYDLVTHVLDHPQGSVEALIGLAGGAETDWLEFKAAMIGRHEDRKCPKENDADGYWNVAEAVLAMANTRGGAVLVGIDDDGHAVGLQAGDPRKVIEGKGLEAYRRIEIKDRICPPSGPCKWQTGLRGTWEIQEAWPPDQFTVRGATHNGQEIAIIIVSPVPANGSCLLALQNGEERLLRRTLGHIGQVESIRGRRSITLFEGSRHPASMEIHSLWERFSKWVEGEETQDEALEAAISAWHEKLRTKVADLLVAFTPLDAAEKATNDELFETPVPRELFEPQATETLPDYLRDDFDEDAESEDGDEQDEEADDLDDAANRPMRRGGLFELLAAEPRAVVLGEPGGGKTTCLRRLALDSETNYRSGGRVTLYAHLARWQAAGGLWSLIRRCTGLSPGQVERLIAADRCCLLLDALNECPDAIRPTAVNALADLLREHPTLPVVITARTGDATATFRLPTFTVEPLTGDQQKGFLRAYLGDPERAEKFLEQIHNQPGGENLASNPLLLRMIVEVARERDDLPAGRALLYRQWISDWYWRESKKASAAGYPILWGIDETRCGLAAIALASRCEGLRSAGDDLALEALGGVVDDPVAFLERMIEGPLILRDEGRLEFRHETFQEYLCAEALLANPSALRDAGRDDFGRWGMPLAYAAEIIDCVPNELMEAAWRVSPWLGAALSSPGDPIPDLNPSLKPLIEWLLYASKPKNAYDLLFEKQWYEADGPLRYTVNRLSLIHDWWYNFEISQLQVAWHPSGAVTVLRRAITLTQGQNVSPSKEYRLPVKSWLKRIKPKDAILLKVLADGVLVSTEEFTKFKQRWIRESTPLQAALMVAAGLCSTKDFEHQKVDWVAVATIKEAAAMSKYGLCRADDFHLHINNWIAQSTPTETFALIDAGIVTISDFDFRRPEWIKNSTPKEAAQLVKKRILTLDDFSERHSKWIKRGTLKSAVRLVNAGILNATDFAGRTREWIDKANPKEAIASVKAGILNTADFAGKIPEWIDATNPKEAVALVKAGWCKADDFQRRMPEWKTNATPRQATLLSKAGFGDPLVFEGTTDDLKPNAAQFDQTRFCLDQLVTEWIAPDLCMLDEKKIRRDTARYLRNHIFSGSVCYIQGECLFAFIKCRNFPRNVFCHGSVWPTESAKMSLKTKVDFSVGIQINMKTGIWGYAVRTVKTVNSTRSSSYLPESASRDNDIKKPAASIHSALIAQEEPLYSLDGIRGLQPVDPSSEDHAEIGESDKPVAP